VTGPTNSFRLPQITAGYSFSKEERVDMTPPKLDGVLRRRSSPERPSGLFTRCFIFLAILTIFETAALSQEKSYWLTHGGTIVGSCEGSRDGEALKAANTDGGWFLITGVITCRDLGNKYAFEIDHLSVQINPKSRARINRDMSNFDWIGLAIYQPDGGGQKITWLYDEGLPLHGSLPKSSFEKIYFGRLKFPDVPKSDVNRASNFTFYMTAEGALFVFGLL